MGTRSRRLRRYANIAIIPIPASGPTVGLSKGCHVYEVQRHFGQRSLLDSSVSTTFLLFLGRIHPPSLTGEGADTFGPATRFFVFGSFVVSPISSPPLKGPILLRSGPFAFYISNCFFPGCNTTSSSAILPVANTWRNVLMVSNVLIFCCCK